MRDCKVFTRKKRLTTVYTEQARSSPPLFGSFVVCFTLRKTSGLVPVSSGLVPLHGHPSAKKSSSGRQFPSGLRPREIATPRDFFLHLVTERGLGEIMSTQNFKNKESASLFGRNCCRAEAKYRDCWLVVRKGK